MTIGVPPLATEAEPALVGAGWKALAWQHRVHGEPLPEPAAVAAKPGLLGHVRVWLLVVCGFLGLGAEVVTVVAMVCNVGTTFTGTVLRYGFKTSSDWTVDLSTIALNIIAFLGSAAILRRGGGIAFNAFVDRWPATRQEAFRVSAVALTGLMILVSLVSVPTFLSDSVTRRSPALHFSELWFAIWLAIGFLLSIVFVIERLARFPARALASGLALTAVVALPLMGWWAALLPLPTDPLLIGAVVGVIAFLFGAPIPYVIAAPALAALVSTDSRVIIALAPTYQFGISNPILLAIPFFLLAGSLMQLGGVAERFGRLLEEWFGWMPGGLLIAATIGMFIFSGVSGSKSADTAAVSAALKESLRRSRYPPHESTAVIANAASVGETIPPSIALIIFGSITSLSISSLFLAGLGPALVATVIMVFGILYRARGGRLPRGDSFRLIRAVRTLPGSLPVFAVPVVIAVGIIGGVGTPTEVSSFAVVYAMIVAALVARSTRPVELWRLFRLSGLTSGLVLWLVATSVVLTQLVSGSGVAEAAVRPLLSVEGPLGFLLLSALFLIVLSAVFEGLPVLLVLGPILVPIAGALGINELQYGIIVIIAMGIGVFLPPIGVGLFVTAAIMDASVEESFRPSLFYSAMHTLGLLVVILVPPITLAIPHFVLHR